MSARVVTAAETAATDRFPGAAIVGARFPCGVSMTTAFIALLAAGTVYVGKKWLDARAEVADLQAQLTILKRRLKHSSR